MLAFTIPKINAANGRFIDLLKKEYGSEGVSNSLEENNLKGEGVSFLKNDMVDIYNDILAANNFAFYNSGLFARVLNNSYKTVMKATLYQLNTGLIKDIMDDRLTKNLDDQKDKDVVDMHNSVKYILNKNDVSYEGAINSLSNGKLISANNITRLLGAFLRNSLVLAFCLGVIYVIQFLSNVF